MNEKKLVPTLSISPQQTTEYINVPAAIDNKWHSKLHESWQALLIKCKKSKKCQLVNKTTNTMQSV